MTTLQLSLPESVASSNRTLDANPKNLGSWLDNLPYLAVVETVREISDRLYLLNRNQVPTGQRLKLMEQFHTAYQRLHESLIDIQLSLTGPLDANEAIKECERLRCEMAFGYKLVVSDSVTLQRSLIKPQEIALAVERAIHYLSLCMIQHYQTYTMIDRSLWREISALYQYGEQKGLLQERILSLTKRAQTTIADTFKRIAFLRISDPYQLPPGNVWDVFNYLGKHKDNIEIQSSQEDTTRAGVLFIDISRARTKDTELEDSEKYSLNGRALIESLVADLEKIRTGGQPVDVGFSERISRAETVQLGTRLLNLWARTPQRVMPRFSGSGTTHLIIGLNAIHNRLLNKHPVPNTELGDIPCSRLNRSTGGLALLCPKQYAPRLLIGQAAAVGISTPSKSTQWLPVIIRWLMKIDEKSVQFGIQYVGDKMTPVRVCTLDARMKEGITHDALKLELRHSSRTLQTIIAPSGVFRKGHKIELIQGDQTSTVRCAQLLESLTTTDRFSFHSQT
ncbi:MAG: hypothetical protein V3R51_01950 [Gammaproteobacteria bacterium]